MKIIYMGATRAIPSAPRSQRWLLPVVLRRDALLTFYRCAMLLDIRSFPRDFSSHLIGEGIRLYNTPDR